LSFADTANALGALMNNVNGIVIVVLSMAAFSLEDMLIKSVSGTISVGQVLLMLGAISAVAFWGIATVQGYKITHRAAWRKVPVLRALTEMFSAVAFVTALSLVELSVVAAVFQATPLVITMGAALFLGEQVGWRRWSAICVGFVGVLIIIRPGLSGFEPASLLVLFAVFGIAARDLLTRVMDEDVPSVMVSFQAYLSLVVAGGFILIVTPAEYVPLDFHGWQLMLGACVTGMLGYMGIVTAMRIGDASAVTPFRYTRLVFSLILGVLIFGERPDTLMLVGAALIIGSGLYTFVRERRLAREARGAPA
jgi:drug/metabolite transporter (DMT)-like permease